MVETCVGPSELHLKKELTALRKSRFLRDPETSSSWRSPVSSRSAATGSWNFKCEHGTKMDDMLNGSVTADVGCNSSSSINENRRKKVYLYNWGDHSRKSSDSGIKINDNSIEETVKRLEENGINIEDPAATASLIEAASDARVRRTSRKQRRKAISKKFAVKNSGVSKLLDLPSSSLSILNSLERYNDGEFSNSEEFQHSARESNHRSGCASQVASPIFSASGCGNWSDSSKILRCLRRDESSCSHTPVSTSSYNRLGEQNASNIGSWDGTAGFDGDKVDQMDLPGRQGCGISCYSSKRHKNRGSGGWYSPSLSDTLKRGSSILCGSHSINHKRSSVVRKRRALPKSCQGSPLLHNGYNQGGTSADSETDEKSTKYGELDLEAISRLDGSRWSSCKSQDRFDDSVASVANEVLPDPRSLSQKYRPKFFEEIIGQNIVVQSLANAVLRGRIAPAYIFQGPRGTGKTCMAKIFAAALNCLSIEKEKPCGFCRECTDFASGNGSNIKEVDGINKKAVDRVKILLKNLPAAAPFSRHTVFVIDECHMLSSKSWSTFIKLLEDPPSRVVFIFITIDPDGMPRAIASRCQRFIFPKVKDTDIISRLKKISSNERLDIELDALDLISLNSNGSLRDAETMLEQLSLLGKQITSSLVHDLIGVVPDEKLLDLLEIAMAADTAETVKKSRELLDSGIDPTRLMSQLAGLIMDIIAGTHRLASSKSDSVLREQRLSETELNRLQRGLKILSDAEKQLRHSSERSTWFIAALLQLGSGLTFESIHSSGSSCKQSIRSSRMGSMEMGKECRECQKSDAVQILQHAGTASMSILASGHTSPLANTCSGISMRQHHACDFDDNGSKTAKHSNEDSLEDLWRRCIQGCHSKTLRNLLSSYGKLVSVTEVDGVLIASIEFEDPGIKSRAERFLSSITNSMEIVLKHTVEIKMGLLSDTYLIEMPNANAEPSAESSKSLKGSFPIFSSKQDEVCDSSDKREGDSRRKDHGTASEERRLESTWLQVADKGTPGSSVDTLKPERNQYLPQNGFGDQNNNQRDAYHLEIELTHEIKSLKIGDQETNLKEATGTVDHFSISPSRLHSNENQLIFESDNLDYESGPGCDGLLCWKANQSRKKGTQLKSKKSRRISCFGRGKSKISSEKKELRRTV